jgi:hypothetical protein
MRRPSAGELRMKRVNGIENVDVIALRSYCLLPHVPDNDVRELMRDAQHQEVF